MAEMKLENASWAKELAEEKMKKARAKKAALEAEVDYVQEEIDAHKFPNLDIDRIHG